MPEGESTHDLSMRQHHTKRLWATNASEFANSAHSHRDLANIDQVIETRKTHDVGRHTFHPMQSIESDQPSAEDAMGMVYQAYPITREGEYEPDFIEYEVYDLASMMHEKHIDRF